MDFDTPEQFVEHYDYLLKDNKGNTALRFNSVQNLDPRTILFVEWIDLHLKDLDHDKIECTCVGSDFNWIVSYDFHLNFIVCEGDLGSPMYILKGLKIYDLLTDRIFATCPVLVGT